VSGFMGHEIWAKLAVVSLSQDVRFKMARACELLDVASIAIDISLQLGKSQIMRLKRTEPQVPPRAGEHGHQSFLVVFGRRRHCDGVEGDLVLLVQGRPLPPISNRSLRMFGTTPRKSMSLVVRTTSYNCVTTKPPQQCR